MTAQIIAQAPAHHARVELVIDLALALFVPILRRNQEHLGAELLHAPRRLVAEAARFVADDDAACLSDLLLQPTDKTSRAQSAAPAAAR